MRFIAQAFAAASLVLVGAAAAPAGALEAGVVCQICTQETQPVSPTPSTPVLFLAEASLSIRVGELREVDRGQAQFALNLAARTFELELNDDLVFSGHLVPKGKSGRKFTAFFDHDSHEDFLDFIASEGEKIAAVFALDVLGDTTKAVLQLDQDGAPSLKLKSRVLMTGPSEFIVKLVLVPRD
jgi:hypothetical protein